jgi:hypothetical protein
VSTIKCIGVLQLVCCTEVVSQESVQKFHRALLTSVDVDDLTDDATGVVGLRL